MLSKLKSSPSVIIFLATLSGYAFAYAYEAGYLSSYGVGAGFVWITPLQLLISATVAIFAVFTVDVAYGMTDNLTKYDRSRALFTILLVLILSLFSGLVASHSATSVRSAILRWLAALAIAILVNILLFFDTVVNRLRGSSWDEALAKHYLAIKNRRNEKVEQLQKHSGLSLIIIPEVLLPLIVIASIFVTCYFYGRSTAQYTDTYVTVLKPEGAIDQIVLRDYGDQLLVKPFDTRSQRLLPGFSIVQATGQTLESTVLKCSSTFIKNNSTIAGSAYIIANCPHQPRTIK